MRPLSRRVIILLLKDLFVAILCPKVAKIIYVDLFLLIYFSFVLIQYCIIYYIV